MTTFVIVGAGQAGAQAADSLRRGGFDGRLVLLGEEPHLPYARPPLSKKYLAGEFAVERLLVKPTTFYERHGIELLLGRKAVALDAAAHVLTLDDGEAVHYDKLLLATGSRSRELTVPGATLVGIHYLRTIADAERIRADLLGATRLVVIGGGYIGLEVAATCRSLGLEVDVIEMTDRVMNRVVAPEVSTFYTREHAEQQVRIHTGSHVIAFEGDASQHVTGVRTGDGRHFPANVVIVGVGAVPAAELAASAGLACENGILVDLHCRTSNEDIFSAGDCCNAPSPRYGRRIRLESVDNSIEQAKTAASGMLGKAATHDRIPWFWSDQYDLKLLIVGVSAGYDSGVLRGDPSTRSFSYCYLRDTELVAIDCVNNVKDFVAAKKLIAERAKMDAEKLRDNAVPLRDARTDAPILAATEGRA